MSAHRCPRCGRPQHIAYEVDHSTQEALDLPHDRDDWPCLECLAGLARERGVELDLSNFHYLGVDKPWVDEGEGDILGQIRALLERLTKPGVAAGQLEGDFFPYDMGSMYIRWTFRAQWVEEKDEPLNKTEAETAPIGPCPYCRQAKSPGGPTCPRLMPQVPVRIPIAPVKPDHQEHNPVGREEKG